MRLAPAVAALILSIATSAFAQAVSPVPVEPKAGPTLQGPEPLVLRPQEASAGRTPGTLGAHVSGVAPEHPLEHGTLFGECVAEMALTGSCPMQMEGD